MKTRIAICFSVGVLSTTALGQGLVNFRNGLTTLISAASGTAIQAPAGSYYFGLLIAPVGTTDPRLFTFSGVYGTNLATAGLFRGGMGVAAANWPAGQTRAFMVAGWSGSLGHDWDPAWLDGWPPGDFGFSHIAEGIAGGFDGTASVPTLFIFSPSTIFHGFSLDWGCLGPYWREILSQPRSQTVIAGGTALFEVGVSACPSPYYQWYFNGVAIPGATRGRYGITNVQPSHAGSYYANLSNPQWPVYSGTSHDSGLATLTVVTSPVITSQPESQTKVVGAGAELKVAALGPAPLSYQWCLNGNPLPDRSNANLVFASLELSDSGTYTVVITNTYGAATSSPAILTVLASPPSLTLSPWSRTATAGTFFDFPCVAAGALPLSYQWSLNGMLIDGATASSLHFDNLQLSNAGSYSVLVTNAFGSIASPPATLTVVPWTKPRSGTIVAWGSNAKGQLNIPSALSNVIAIAAGESRNLAIDSDGAIHAWGENVPTPPSPVHAVAVSESGIHSLALLSNGTVTGWGSDYSGQLRIPAGLSNVVAIAAGGQHSLALRSDGVVFGWGAIAQSNVPPNLCGVVAIAAGARHNVALQWNGAVVTWGSGGWAPGSPSVGAAKAIAAGGDHSLALRSDGTVVAWGGMNYYGVCDVPPGLSGVTAITTGWDYFNYPDSHNLALKSDGTVVAWGYGTQGQGAVPLGLSNVISIAAGVSHNLALVSQAPFILVQPSSQTAESGATATFFARATGRPPLAYQWLFEGTQPVAGGTRSALRLESVQPAQAGIYQLVVASGGESATSAPAVLSVISVVSRRMVPGLVLTAEPASLLNIDYTPQLTPPDWRSFPAVSFTNNPQFYFDLSDPLPAQRFYRAWQTGPPNVRPSASLPGMVPALTLIGTIGSRVKVEGINQIGPTDAWYTLGTVTLTETPQLYFDTSTIGQPTRLYRLSPVP